MYPTKTLTIDGFHHANSFKYLPSYISRNFVDKFDTKRVQNFMKRIPLIFEKSNYFIDNMYSTNLKNIAGDGTMGEFMLAMALCGFTEIKNLSDCFHYKLKYKQSIDIYNQLNLRGIHVSWMKQYMKKNKCTNNWCTRITNNKIDTTCTHCGTTDMIVSKILVSCDPGKDIQRLIESYL